MKMIHEFSLTYRTSLLLPVVAQRLCGVELEVEDGAELGVVEPLHQFIRVYQPVLSEVLVQPAVRLSHLIDIWLTCSFHTENRIRSFIPTIPWT
jgi:hypothetical protein